MVRGLALRTIERGEEIRFKNGHRMKDQNVPYSSSWVERLPHHEYLCWCTKYCNKRRGKKKKNKSN